MASKKRLEPVAHHSNSRRFKCACGRVHKYWPQDPEENVRCGCGRLHYRSSHASPIEPKTVTYYLRGHEERGYGRRAVWRDVYSANGPDGGPLYPWLTKREAYADARRQGAHAVFKRVVFSPAANIHEVVKE